MNRPPFSVSPRLHVFAIFSVTIIAFAIAILSLIPTADLPQVSGSDKIKHAVAYAALAAPLAVWMDPRRWVLAICIATLFGAGIEIVQLIAPTGRSGSTLDALANAIGALLGAGLTKLIFRSD